MVVIQSEFAYHKLKVRNIMRLGEEVRHLERRKILLTNIVTINLNVLSLVMKDEIFSNLYNILVILVERIWTGRRNTKVS